MVDAWGIKKMSINIETDNPATCGEYEIFPNDPSWAMPDWLWDYLTTYLTCGDAYSPVKDIPVCKTPGCRNRHLIHQH